MRRFIIAAAFFLLAPLGAAAGERLLVPQPQGWVPVVGHADPGAELAALVPAGESADDWTRRITVQAFRGVARTVPEFLTMLPANAAAVCDGVHADEPRLGRLGPLEAGSRAVACGRLKAETRGEYALTYAIRGREAFYVVIREWRGAPFPPSERPVEESELADWLAFLRAVRVCDTTDPARPCAIN